MPAPTLSAGFAFQTRSEAISLPWLIVIALVHAGVVVTVAAAGHPSAPKVSPPTVTMQVEMISPAPAMPVAPARVEKFFTPQQPVKREMAPRAKRQITKAPAPTPKASEVIAAPAVADSPLENAPESAPPQPESAMTAAATPALIETTQARFDANYLRNPAPAYPAMSRRLGEEGRVVLRVFVDIDGRPEQVELKNSSGFPRLDQAAEDAVRRWKFVPAKRGEEAVATWVAVPIVFNLKTS